MDSLLENSLEIDRAIGARLCELRKEVGLTQEELAKKISISFQQLQKYEKGVNRISAAKLYVIVKELNLKQGDFFSSVSEKLHNQQLSDNAPNFGLIESVSDEEKLNIIKLFAQVPSLTQRKKVFNLLKDIVQLVE